jgi:hypothetical integral membrane protein (TIGR02206 family)
MQSIEIIPGTFSWAVMVGCCVSVFGALLIVGKRVSMKCNSWILNSFGLGMLLNLLFMEGYLWYKDLFALSVSLPLAYCSIMEMFAICAALFKSKRAFEFSLFFGISGPLQAFVSSVQVAKGEEYLLIDYFASHALTIFVPIFMAVCMKYVPRKGSLLRVILGMEVIAAMVYWIDLQLGANYMYLIEKPEVVHLLNVGQWPYYLIGWHGWLYSIAGFIYALFVFNRYLNKKTTGCL